MNYIRSPKPKWLNKGLYRSELVKNILAAVLILIAMWLYFSIVENSIGPMALY